jgi:hypothetical protein
MTENVDLFADVAASLFLRLRTAFPIPVDIEIDVLADAAMPDGDPEGATREALVEASIHWLGAAGLIAFEPGQMGARMIERVGFTARGFMALQKCDEDGTIGRALQDATAPERRRALVGKALTAAS